MITVLHTLRFLARCDRKILNKLCFKSISWREGAHHSTARLVLVALPTGPSHPPLRIDCSILEELVAPYYIIRINWFG